MLSCGMDPKGVMAELTGKKMVIPKERVDLCICSVNLKISMADMAL